MDTQAIQFIGEDGKMFRLPAEATLREMVSIMGVNAVRMVSKDVPLAKGEARATLQSCQVCSKDVVSVNIHGYCPNCE